MKLKIIDTSDYGTPLTLTFSSKDSLINEFKEKVWEAEFTSPDLFTKGHLEKINKFLLKLEKVKVLSQDSVRELFSKVDHSKTLIISND